MDILYSCFNKCVHFIQKKFSRLFFGLFAWLVFGMGNLAIAQISENFQSWATQGTYNTTTSNQTGSGGNWNYISTIISPTALTNGTGSKGLAQLQSQNGILTLPTITNGVGVLTIQARVSSTNGGFSIEKNNGSGWVLVKAESTSSITGIQFQYTVNDGSPSVQLRINNTGGTGNRALYIHDVTTTVYSVITSIMDGDWDTKGTWSGNIVPIPTDNVIINHKVTSVARTRNSGSTTVIGAGGSLAVSDKYDNQGATTVNGTFQIDNGGYATGNDFVYGTTGSLNFNTTGNYGVNIDPYWPFTSGPYNVSVMDPGLGGTPAITLNVSRTVNGTFQTAGKVNNAGNLTLNGTGKINPGGNFYNSSVNWGAAATLIYNANINPFPRSFEWNAGIGGTEPANVQLSNNTVLNYPAGGNAARTLTGYLTIDAGSALYMDYGAPTSGVGLLSVGDITINGNLSLGDQPGGDLAVKGNWVRRSAASFKPTNRAVFFNGSSFQTVTVTGGGNENFDYLFVQNSSTLKLDNTTNLAVNKSNGLDLSSTAGTTIDLNGRLMTLTGGGNLNIGSGARNINSSTGSGILNIISSNVTVTGSGTGLTFGANTSLQLNIGLNCGTGSLVTINGTLNIAFGGFVLGTSPRYGTASLLLYSSGSKPYARQLEWTTQASPTAGNPGLPNNVQITNGTEVNYINTLDPGNKYILGNLTIDNVPPNTSALYMDFGGVSCGGPLTIIGNVNVAGNLSLGSASGDDLKTEGDLNLMTGYTLTTNNRAIYFTKNGTQNIFTPSGNALTLPKIILGKAGGGTTLKINQDLTAAINANAWDVINFTNAADVLDLNVGRTLIIGQSTYSNAISGPGKFKGSTTSNISLLGVGNAGTFNFVTGFQNLGTFDINRSNNSIGASLGNPVTINSSLNLNAGFLSLGDNDLSLTTGATLGGNTPSTSTMVVTGGTGKFVKYFSGPGSYTYPIGDTTGTPEYSPATLSFTGGSYSGKYTAVNVVNLRHPQNMASANYTKRYWNVATTITGYICDATFNYVTPLADVVGTEANMVTGGWDGTNWYLGNAANTTTHTLSVSGETALKNSYTGGDVFSPLGSLITDYYRSKAPGGNWNVKGSWESSPSGVSGWHDATLVPTSSASGIEILNGHIITLTANATAKLLKIDAGGILTSNNFSGGYSLTIADDGTTVSDFNIYGTYVLFGTQPTFNSGATGTVYNGGLVRADNNYLPGNSDNFGYSNKVLFKTGAIFEWNTTNLFGTSGITYFVNSASTDIPIFKLSNISGTPGLGAGSPTTFNGIFQVNYDVTFAGGKQKNFRNGISGNSTLTQNTTSGNSFHITALDAILGGTALKIILNTPLVLDNNVTVPAGSIATVSGGNIDNTGNTFTINGTLDVTTINLSPNSTTKVYGTYRTANPGGFSGGGSSIPGGTINVFPNSTVELYALGAQSLTARSDFANLIFSGSGIKTVSNSFTPFGTVTIQDNAILDCTPDKNIGDGSSLGITVTNLTMTGNSRLRLGTATTNPMMGGTYNLTGGVVEFASSQLTAQTILNKTYQNIEITGNNVGNSAGNISLNPAGTFKVKSTGVFTMNDNTIKGVTNGTASVTLETGGLFKSGNNMGFNGFPANLSQNSSIHSNITSITLQAGSTVEYSRSMPPLSSDYQPITVANSLVYQNLKLSGTGNKIAPSDTAILTIKGNFTKTTASNFVHNGGTVLFNGTSDQSYSSASPIMTLYNMTNSSSNLIINDSLALLKKLQLTDGSKLSLTNGDMVLKSNDTTTANIAPIGNATIAYGTGNLGRFVVERFIPNHSKAWQFLAVPTKGSTINQAWQEGNVPIANSKLGYGTIISSNLLPPDPTSLGFDITSFSPSMKTYRSATDDFIGVPDTKTTLIANPSGYFLFVRGDRSITTIGQGPTATILRTRGKIYAPGSEAPYTITTLPGSSLFTSIGNPYASAVDFNKIAALSGLGNTYFVWDPKLATIGTGTNTSAYGYGGFVTISNGATAPATPTYPSTGVLPPIQSGQAFIIQNNATSTVIKFNESVKVDGSSIVTRPGDFTQPNAQLRGNLYVNYNNEHILIDGELTQLQPSYDAGLDGMDARKLMNNGENMGITSHGTTLAIERRPMPLVTDTLFYQLSNMKQKPYRFEFIATKMDISGLEGYVYDRFLKTETTLNMSDTTYIDFNVTGDTHSSASTRFMIYFKPSAGLVPANFTNVNAHLQNKDVIVEWKTENEKDMNGYTLQASLDGTNFKPMTSIKATNNGVGNYAYTDADAVPGYHYYRIQSVDVNGRKVLSRIVKVWVGSGKNLITIYPNPIRNNEVNLQFEGQLQGAYKARLLNSEGQVLVSKEINFAGGSGNETIQLDQYTAHGVYHLEITQPDGKKLVLKVMK